MNIILTPSLELARSYVRCHGEPFMTVEAEYGSVVVEGKHTLAHHTGHWKSCPAPCANEAVRGIAAGQKGYILISHIDLDTVGGIFQAMKSSQSEIDQLSKPFWDLAEQIDLNGPHTLSEDHPWFFLFHGLWLELDILREQTHGDTQDVTSLIEGIFPTLEAVELYVSTGRMKPYSLFHSGKLRFAAEKALNITSLQRVHSGFVVRHSEKWVNALYDVYTQDGVKQHTTDAIIGWNPKSGSITLTFRKPTLLGHHAGEIMQELFGPLAGGHAGAAGSPRGVFMTEDQVQQLVEKLTILLS